MFRKAKYVQKSKSAVRPYPQSSIVQQCENNQQLRLDFTSLVTGGGLETKLTSIGTVALYTLVVPSKKTETHKKDHQAQAGRTPERHPEATLFAERLRQIIDRLALLIMRELSMNVRRFQDIEAQTKIGAPLLTSRLKRLERDGIIERRLYREHPPRYEYFATEKGRDLDAFLFAAGDWNVKWGDLTEPSLIVYDKSTGKRLTGYPRQVRGRVSQSNRQRGPR